jgi:hypothetical protein
MRRINLRCLIGFVVISFACSLCSSAPKAIQGEPGAAPASVLGEWQEYWGTPGETDVTYHDQYSVTQADDTAIKVTILNRKQLIINERVENNTLTFTQHTDNYVVRYSLTLQPDNKWMVGTATTPYKVVNVKWERTKGGAAGASIPASSVSLGSSQTEAQPGSSNVYVNRELGISFVVPNGIKLYTAESPGPLGSQISNQEPIILVNPDFTEENINLQIIRDVSDSDVIGYKKLLDERPTMPLPEYRRVSVTLIQIGSDHTKTAVEHIYFMKGNIQGKMRGITFAHNGKGFTFTCGTSPERFDKANQDFIGALFDSMKFE